MQRDDQLLVPKWLWLWVPIVLCIVYFSYFILHKLKVVRNFNSFMHGEFGIIENLTVLFAVIAIIPIIILFRKGQFTSDKLLKGFLVCFALGCFVIAGEELSWGQHFFGWQTPESLAAINKQQETNLHNINGFGNKARTVLSALIFIFGGLMPLFRWFKYKKLHSDRDKKMWWLWPSFTCVSVGLLSFVITLPQRLSKIGFKIPHPGNIAEIKECMVTLFFLIFIVTLFLRLHPENEDDAVSDSNTAA